MLRREAEAAAALLLRFGDRADALVGATRFVAGIS
jgi:hypothetical protein